MAKRRRLKVKYGVRKLTVSQYLTFRTSTGKITKGKNVRSDRKYIIEVRSKRTKGIIGYFNDKNLTPIKFKKIRKRKVFKAKLKPKLQRSFILNFNTSRPLIEQIRNTKRGQFVVDSILSFIRRNGSAIIGGTLESSSFPTVFIADRNFTRKAKREEIEGHLAIEMAVNMLHLIGFRASPKKFARHPEREHARKLKLTVDILNF